MGKIYTIGLVASRNSGVKVTKSYGLYGGYSTLSAAEEALESRIEELRAGTLTWDEKRENRIVAEDSFNVDVVSPTKRIVTFVNQLGDKVEIDIHIGENNF